MEGNFIEITKCLYSNIKKLKYSNQQMNTEHLSKGFIEQFPKQKEFDNFGVIICI